MQILRLILETVSYLQFHSIIPSLRSINFDTITRLNGWGFKRIEAGTTLLFLFTCCIDVDLEELILFASPNIQVVTITRNSSEACPR